MSITRTYHCDGCGKALEHDEPILHVEVAASHLDDHGADGPLRLRRKRRRMRIRDERCTLLDFCGDCRTQPLPIGALLDKRCPPPVTCAHCAGRGFVVVTSNPEGAIEEECPVCDGEGEAFA